MIYGLRIDHLLLCIVLPGAIVLGLHITSSRRLQAIRLVRQSTLATRFFIYSRVAYWYAFAMMSSAFLLGMVLYGGNGAQTRDLVAYQTHGSDNVPTFILEGLGSVLLPVIFATLFTGLISLGFIGRGALRMMPADEKPTEEFTRFRFTFVLMALSLVLPPLAFGALMIL